MTATHTVDVDGARLHYEVRGSGPLVLVMGSPMDAGAFAPVAEALARWYTVVTHDPRGISHSTIDDPAQESTPELRADDVAAILDALNAPSADVFGSSGGALTGLALATHHPDRVRTLIAHEPPTVLLLPDPAEQRARVEEIIATFHQEGQGAAWMKFMINAGYGAELDEHAPQGEPSEQDIRNGERFFAHELRASALYQPDVATLRSGSARVVIGVGAESRHLITYRTSLALAALLQTQPMDFPGDHGGFIGEPDKFAAVMHDMLAGE